VAARVSSPVFAGRADELAQLVAAMTHAAEGTPGLVLVGGEAGVGKSRLVGELAARAATGDRMRVLVGQCVALDEATIPLLPVADALRGLADDGAPDLPRAEAGSASAALAEDRRHDFTCSSSTGSHRPPRTVRSCSSWSTSIGPIARRSSC